MPANSRWDLIQGFKGYNKMKNARFLLHIKYKYKLCTTDRIIFTGKE
jgi:hypothetical protein